MEAHLWTERALREMGVSHTSVREGVYAEAWPLFCDWFPESREVCVPGDGGLAWVAREELAEATAKLMVGGKYDHLQMVVLSGVNAYTLERVVQVVNEVTGREVRFRKVGEEEFVGVKTADDRGGKGEGFFRQVVSWYEAIERGDAGLVTGTLTEVLGRQPVDGLEVIRGLLRKDGDYRWHQNEPGLVERTGGGKGGD